MMGVIWRGSIGGGGGGGCGVGFLSRGLVLGNGFILDGVWI